MDTAILNTILFTFTNNSLDVIKDGAVGWSSEKINFVGKTKDLEKKNYEQLIDGKNHITMPGLINSHIHSGFSLLKGAAQDLPEIEWMNKGIGPFSKHLTKETRIFGSKIAVLEGIRTGTTTFTEYSASVSDLVENVFLPFKARVVPIETINEVVSDRTKLSPTDLYDLDSSKGEKGLKKAKGLYQSYQKEPIVHPSFGPQAVDMVTIETIEEICIESEKINCKFHMHIAQGERERIQIKKRFGNDKSAITVLDENNLLSKNLVAVHIHDSSKKEKELLIKNEVPMVGCPTCIVSVDGIVPPVAEFSKLGGIAGIGTDQSPGPNSHNMFQEIRQASLFSKIISSNPMTLPPWEVLLMGTAIGSQVLGLESSVGSLEVGKKADIITIDLQNANLIPYVFEPFKNFVPMLMYSTTGTEVDNVIINGKTILKDKKFVEIDEYKILNKANDLAEDLFKRGSSEWIKAQSKMVEYSKKGFI